MRPLELNDKRFQFDVLDSLAANETIRTEYSESFQKHRSIQKELEILREGEGVSVNDLDYLQFQLEELKGIPFETAEELLEAEAQLKKFENAGEIRSQVGQALSLLSESDINVEGMLSELEGLISRLESFDSKMLELSKRVNSSLLELQDVAGELNRLAEEADFDQEDFNQLQENTSLVFRLFKKHTVNSIEELLEIREKVEVDIDNILNRERKLEELAKVLKVQEEHLISLGIQLSETRSKASTKLEEAVNENLGKLGMPGAKLKVELSRMEKGEFSTRGIDNVEYLFQSNPGSKAEPVRKVASGGELSRLMLSIKVLVAESVDFPTMIFDEIDTGSFRRNRH